VNEVWFMSLRNAAEVAVSISIVKPILGKKFGDGAAMIVPLVRTLISGTTF
jgi:hypothetical protein